MYRNKLQCRNLQTQVASNYRQILNYNKSNLKSLFLRRKNLKRHQHQPHPWRKRRRKNLQNNLPSHLLQSKHQFKLTINLKKSLNQFKNRLHQLQPILKSKGNKTISKSWMNNYRNLRMKPMLLTIKSYTREKPKNWKKGWERMSISSKTLLDSQKWKRQKLDT